MLFHRYIYTISYSNRQKEISKYNNDVPLNIVLDMKIRLFHLSARLINMLISLNSKSVISTHIFVVIVQCPANENNFFGFTFEIHARFIRLSFQVKIMSLELSKTI